MRSGNETNHQGYRNQMCVSNECEIVTSHLCNLLTCIGMTASVCTCHICVAIATKDQQCCSGSYHQTSHKFIHMVTFVVRTHLISLHCSLSTQTEQALLDVGREPESADDFDRLLLTHPNSSALWVQYMAFYLHTAEVDRARGVAERALKTISFR